MSVAAAKALAYKQLKQMNRSLANTSVWSGFIFLAHNFAYYQDNVLNYFELFSLPTSFSINLSGLSQTYRELQKQYHPDNFAMQDDATRLQAMQKSTEVNDAFQTLKDSCLRAQYLLKLKGMDIELEQRTLQDTEFLMQQMQWREQIESFSEDDEEEMEAFAEQIKGLVKGLEKQIEDSFHTDELAETANLIRKLKFMLKLQVELELLEEKLFD